MSKSLLLCALVALALATCSGRDARAQVRVLPPFTAYELQAQEACRDGEHVLVLTSREVLPGNQRVPLVTLLHCIAAHADQVLKIECHAIAQRCKAPVVTRESVGEFRQLLKIMTKDPSSAEA